MPSSRVVYKNLLPLNPISRTIAAQFSVLFHIEISAHMNTLHTLLYKYPKAGSSFTVIN